MAFDAFVRDFLAFYFSFVGLHYTVRLMALRARTGIRHAHPGRRGTPNRRHQMLFRAFRGAILAVCVLRVPFPQIDAALGLVGPLQQPWIAALGVVVLLAALGLVDYVHSYMHAEWRSGLNDEPLGALITTGPFRVTRNPSFVGIIAGQIGFALALPSVFSVICLGVGIFVIRRQIEVEERLLPGRFGTAYDAYLRTVPRWPSRASLARWRKEGVAGEPAANAGDAGLGQMSVQ